MAYTACISNDVADPYSFMHRIYNTGMFVAYLSLTTPLIFYLINITVAMFK